MDNLEPNTLHQTLGVIAFVIILIMGVLDGFEWFNASPRIVAILSAVFLVLIGFGMIIETWLKNR